MIDWIEMGRRTLDMPRCEFWQDIVRLYGLHREAEEAIE